MVKRILVVDDDPSIRAMLRLMLQLAGFEVIEAHHGADALEKLKGSLPDLVLTDMMMPVMDGGELIRHLRSDAGLAGLPILVVSGNPDATEAGSMADAVMGKPFRRAELVAAVNALLAVKGD